ncbi:MAG: PLDc N-terminal domain-containing protein [Candidatus Micrarchaeota archaeon]
MDFVKWAIILSALFLALPIVCIIIYIITPNLISVLTGTGSAGGCDYTGPAAEGNASSIGSAISNLCNTSKTFLGAVAMILIILASPVLFISNALASFEIFATKVSGGQKVLWLAIIWVFPAIGGLAYLFKGRKEIKGA